MYLEVHVRGPAAVGLCAHAPASRLAGATIEGEVRLLLLCPHSSARPRPSPPTPPPSHRPLFTLPGPWLTLLHPASRCCWIQVPNIPGLLYTSGGLAYENGALRTQCSLPDWGTPNVAEWCCFAALPSLLGVVYAIKLPCWLCCLALHSCICHRNWIPRDWRGGRCCSWSHVSGVGWRHRRVRAPTCVCFLSPMRGIPPQSVHRTKHAMEPMRD